MITTEGEEELKKDQKKPIDKKQLDIAMQILQEKRKKDEVEQEDDPYTDMAKKLDKKNKRESALRSATSQVEEEKKQSSSEDENTHKKFEKMASKIEENREPLRVWSRRIKIGVALLFLASTAFMNGVFSGQNSGEVVDRSYA